MDDSGGSEPHGITVSSSIGSAMLIRDTRAPISAAISARIESYIDTVNHW